MQTTPWLIKNPHPRSNLVARLTWRIVWVLLFRPTPWFMAGWRNWLLRRFGARIGRCSHFKPTAEIWAPWRLELGSHVAVDYGVYLYDVFGIKVGQRVVISRGAFLCTATHDYHDPCYPLTGGQITLEDDCWIAADAFIGPGVTVGRGAVVGARAVVVKDVAPWTVVAGNPAKFIKERKLREA